MASQQEENTNSLVTKPGTNSIVWDYFGLRKDPEGRPIDNGCGVPFMPSSGCGKTWQHFQPCCSPMSEPQPDSFKNFKML